MYPARFEYHAPTSLEEALALLDRLGEEGKVLAGGQSLIPMMKLRFAVPAALVDINRLPGLDRIEDERGSLRIGALVRHKACERSEALRGRFGVLGAAAPKISDPIVRNLGTVAGSLAHADPQGDWASALLALDGEVVIRSSSGERTLPVRELLRGPFTTALEPGEIVTAVRVPDPGPRAAGTYMKLERKVGDFATVGVAVHVTTADGRVGRAGIALTAVGPINFRAAAAEEVLQGSALEGEAIAEAGRLAAAAAQPKSDMRGSAEYKRRVVRVFVERGLREVAGSLGFRPAPGSEAALSSSGAPGSGEVPRAREVRPGQASGEDYFAGEETVEGVMEEVREKDDG